MSIGAVILIVILVIVAALVIGGFLATRRRTSHDTAYEAHVAQADEALEVARAADKGWDREVLDGVVRRALTGERPEALFEEIHLVLVEDREGVDEDLAHFVAIGPNGEARVILVRHGGEWELDRIE